MSESRLLIFCGLGIAQSVFFAFCLLSFRDGEKTSNRIFALLLVALAIRLSKSLVYYFFTLDPIFMNVGYAAHAAIGPLLYLYVSSRCSGSKSLRISDALHMLPACLVLILAARLTEPFWLPLGYAVLLYYSLAYFCMTWIKMLSARASGRLETVERRWLITLLTTVSILGLAYFSNFILGLTSYITGPLIYSIMIYIISYIGFRFYNEIFGLKIPFRKTSTIPVEDAHRYMERLNQIFSESRPYLDPGLNLSSLAKIAGMQPYRLSQLINEQYQMSFSDFINKHRIEEAKSKLTDPHESKKKVATIAYEVGFNTLSAFNSSFKKQTSQTPKEYRKSKSLSLSE